MNAEGPKTGGLPPARVAAGREIARLIDHKFVSRKEFSNKSGVDPKKLSDLVNGRKKMDADLADRLADCLGETADFFWNLEDQLELDGYGNRTNKRKDDLVDAAASDASRSYSENNGQILERFSIGARSMELVAGTSPERIKAIADIILFR